MTDINETLKERGNNYGKFSNHALLTQKFKAIMRSSNSWSNLTPSMKECLEMVQHKIARILNGNPDYIDSWHDIIGYVSLVEKELLDSQKKQ